MKVNGDIITKTELEQRQVAVAAAAPERAGRSDDDEERRAAEEDARRVTPQILVNAVDELLLAAARPRARATPWRRSVQERRRQHPQGAGTRRRREVPGGPQAGRHDDGRPAASSSSGRCMIEQVQRQEVGSKLTITEDEARQYYAAAPGGIHRPGVGDAARDPRRRRRRRPSGVNVGARRGGEGEDRSDPRTRAHGARTSRKLAGEVSTSPSKANGGLIGPFSHDDMSPQLQELRRQDEAGRHHAGDSHAAGLSAAQARSR